CSNNLVRGGKALSAGELGHICVQLDGRQCGCGQKGCYEAYCGGRALALRMQEELKDKPDSMIMQIVNGEVEKIDMIVLEKAVRAGDAYALALWDEMSLRNAQAFGLFINAFNPEKLILGTMAWAIGDLYTDPILKYLPRFCWDEPREACQIVSSELKRNIGAYAGIAAALNYLKEH
ncbi:MAG: ROK family protein, partial [Lentisphaeria bacterium]|nr:ROK family protein [Lentisphaeria bacterium]